jgi:hypothetical protein
MFSRVAPALCNALVCRSSPSRATALSCGLAAVACEVRLVRAAVYEICEIPSACSALATLTCSISASTLELSSRFICINQVTVPNRSCPALFLAPDASISVEVSRCPRAAFCKIADFIGDHREAHPRLPCAGGLHRGVEPQNIGLESDLDAPISARAATCCVYGPSTGARFGCPAQACCRGKWIQPSARTVSRPLVRSSRPAL